MDGGGQVAVPVCPRHPDRVSYVRCQRCQQPVCADCQQPAAVGVQCVSCVAEARKGDRPHLTVTGGRASRSQTPVLTIGIIAICVAVWLGELTIPRVFEEVAFAPFLGESEPWRLLTSAFAHSPNSPMHIMFNMLALWLVGGYLETILGKARYIGLYVASALAGTVVWLLFQPVNSTIPVVGASGAVFGLFGAVVVLNRHLGRDSSGMIATIGINAVIGFLIPNVAWQAHLGGMLAGAVIAFVLTEARKRRNPAIAWTGIVAVIVLCVVVAVLKYALGDPSPEFPQFR